MSSNAPRSSADPQISAAAERWLGRHDRGLSPEERLAFAAWRATSPAHATEFDRLAAAWHAADLLKADPQLTALAAQLDARTQRAQSARQVRRARLAWATGLAAAAAAVALAFLQPWRSPASNAPSANTVAVAATASVQVRPASAQRVTLPDGSVALLRGDSEIQHDFTTTERRVRLIRGEAFFTVTKDAARPFVVATHRIGVRAIGTAFNVKLSSDALDVLVTEGIVGLSEQPANASTTTGNSAPVAAAPLPSSAPRARAGEQARLTLVSGQPALTTAAITPVSPADIDRILDWQVARLTFQRATLAEAIAAFNAHGGTRFELADAALASVQVGGSYRADRAEAFVRVLEQASEVRVERAPDGHVRLHVAL